MTDRLTCKLLECWNVSCRPRTNPLSTLQTSQGRILFPAALGADCGGLAILCEPVSFRDSDREWSKSTTFVNLPTSEAPKRRILAAARVCSQHHANERALFAIRPTARRELFTRESSCQHLSTYTLGNALDSLAVSAIPEQDRRRKKAAPCISNRIPPRT